MKSVTSTSDEDEKTFTKEEIKKYLDNSPDPYGSSKSTFLSDYPAICSADYL